MKQKGPDEFPFDEIWYSHRYCIPGSDAASLRRHHECSREKGYAGSFEEESAEYQKRLSGILCTQLMTAGAHLPHRDGEGSSEKEHPGTEHRDTVIFSAVARNYDSIKIPQRIRPSSDYVLFSDTPQTETGVWQIRPVPFWNRDTTRITRYVKLHPHVLFPDHSLAIWIDQNIVLLDDLQTETDDFLASGLPIGTFHHPTRYTVQDEGLVCMKLRKDDPGIIREQLIQYAKEAIPCQELAYTNVMFFNLRHPLLPRILTTWWRELERYSKRDQLSFCYAVAKHHASWHPLAHAGICAGNHPGFGVLQHDRNHGICASIVRSLGDTLRDPFAGRSFSAERGKLLRTVRDIPVAVCIMLHSGLSQSACQACLTSVLRNFRASRYQIRLVCDTGFDSSHPGMQDLLQQLRASHASVRICTVPGSPDAGRHLSEELSDGSDYLILLQGDTIVTERAADKLVLALRQSPCAGIVGALSNNASFQSVPVADQGDTPFTDLPDGVTAERLNRLCELWSVSHIIPRVPLLNPFCLGLTRDAFLTLGGIRAFSAQPSPSGIADFSFRATDLGIEQILATNTYIYRGRNSASGNPPDLRGTMETYGQMYGKERVTRSWQTMLFHPVLQELRTRMQYLFATENVRDLPADDD